MNEWMNECTSINEIRWRNDLIYWCNKFKDVNISKLKASHSKDCQDNVSWLTCINNKNNCINNYIYVDENEKNGDSCRDLRRRTKLLKEEETEEKEICSEMNVSANQANY